MDGAMKELKHKYTFELSDRFLSEEECDIFNDFLTYYNLDKTKGIQRQQTLWNSHNC